jgi:hypothetical protein
LRNMKPKFIRKILISGAVIAALAMTFMMAAPSMAETSPSISTDKPDYAPEELVTITGVNFAPDTTVTVSVSRPDGITTDSSQGLSGPYSVTITSNPDNKTDDNGGFTAVYQLDGIFGTYTVSANDGTNIATTTFTDAYNTTTTLNSILTENGSVTHLIAGNTYSFSGQVTSANALYPVPDGYPVTLQWCATSNFGGPAGSVHDLASPNTYTDASSNHGLYSGTFTAPTPATSGDTLYFRAYFAKVTIGSGSDKQEWSASASDDGSADPQAIVVQIKLSQTITFPAISDKTYGDADFDPGATASSGLPVSYSASGNCTIVSGLVHITGAGSGTVTASQAGNDTYAAAPDVSRSFNIAKASPTVTVIVGTYAYNGSAQGPDTYTTNPTGDTGTPTWSYSGTTNGGASYDPTATKPTLAGSYSATVSLAADDNFNAASSVATAFTIAKADTSISVSGPDFGIVGSPITFTATLSAPGPLNGLAIQFNWDGYSSSGLTTNGLGVATWTFIPENYDTDSVIAAFLGNDNLNGCDNEITAKVLVVYDAGAAATGGGWVNNNGRENFGFTVKLVEGTLNTYKGQFVVVQNGKWKIKGTLNTYGTNGTNGFVSGSGMLFQWVGDSTTGSWVSTETIVGVTISFADNNSGTGTGNGKKSVTVDTIGIQISGYDFTGSSFNPNVVGGTSLSGGNIDIKSPNNTTDGDPTTPPSGGKGKNK